MCARRSAMKLSIRKRGLSQQQSTPSACFPFTPQMDKPSVRLLMNINCSGTRDCEIVCYKKKLPSWPFAVISMSRRKMSMFMIQNCGAELSCALMANGQRFANYAKAVSGTRSDCITKKAAFLVGGITECFHFQKIAVYA